MTIDVNSDVELSGDLNEVITVPMALLLNEFFTRTGMLDCCATQSPKGRGKHLVLITVIVIVIVLE